jgi:hypothetical protein
MLFAYEVVLDSELMIEYYFLSAMPVTVPCIRTSQQIDAKHVQSQRLLSAL